MAKLEGVKNAIVTAAKSIEEKAKDASSKISEETIKLIDENNNGKIDLVDFVIKAIKTPGIKINRAEYLQSAFKRYCNEETIAKAISTNPAKAGISKDIVDKTAKESITLQKTIATTASLGLGYVPGGLAVDAATTVADLVQYYGQLLVIMQKLMYLYGYPELELDRQDGSIDDGTMNLIIIGIGTMAGVNEATKFLSAITEKLAVSVPKQVLKKGFSTKIAYQVAKKVLKYFGITLTKEVATKGISNAIKFVGGILMGGITFVGFGSACNNFYKALKDTPLSNPNYVDESNVIDVDVIQLEEDLKKEIGVIEDIEEE